MRSLGRAAGTVLKKKCPAKKWRVIAVRDTRSSGASLLQELAWGLRQVGVNVFDAGVLSTPSVAYLVKTHKFQSGVVISASHNPPEFNGIKFFTSLGRKWPDSWEDLVEEIFFSRKVFAVSKNPGALVEAGSLHGDYEEFLVDTLQGKDDFSGLRLAVDCSNGANSETAPELLRRLGAQVIAIGVNPNGRNINVGCGSQHTEKLSQVVRQDRCDVGIAFDGDGDRVIFVDENGCTLDGDHVLALLGKYLKKKKLLKNNTVVITVMANLGLKKALSQMGIRVVQVAVGDRYVSEAMQKEGAVLGGEQSGHIILGAYLPTGDGLLTALHTLSILKQENKNFSQLVGGMKKFPQILVNLPVKERIPLDELDGVQPLILGIQRKLGDCGRVLVRYSGTEPLLRIMLEGPDKKKLEVFSSQIANAVKSASLVSV